MLLQYENSRQWSWLWELNLSDNNVTVYRKLMVSSHLRSFETDTGGSALDNSKDNAMEALHVLTAVMEERDPFSKHHSVRVKTIAMRLAKVSKVDEAMIKVIGNAGLLHDVGMVCVPDSILLKAGRFTDIEKEVVQNAPIVAGKILEHIPSLEQERLIIMHHGERWDGSGYPNGLVGTDIPLGSRFVAIAETIDAMTRNRAYRKRQPLSYCLDYLHENVGVKFDPDIANVAISSITKGMVKTHVVET